MCNSSLKQIAHCCSIPCQTKKTGENNVNSMEGTGKYKMLHVTDLNYSDDVVVFGNREKNLKENGNILINTGKVKS